MRKQVELRLTLLAFKRTYNEQWMLEKYDHRSRQWFEGNHFYDSGEPTPCCNNLLCSPREFNPIRERFRLTPLIGVISLESIYPLRLRVSARRVRDE